MLQPIISCICLTCGVRNDHSTENGYCQNGHDDWLEQRDIEERNETFVRAVRLTNLTAIELTEQFMNPDVKTLQLGISQKPSASRSMYRNELKIDLTTLPKDGQKIRCDTHRAYDIVGEFDAEEFHVFVSETEWYPMWDVLSWEPVDEETPGTSVASPDVQQP